MTLYSVPKHAYYSVTYSKVRTCSSQKEYILLGHSISRRIVTGQCVRSCYRLVSDPLSVDEELRCAGSVGLGPAELV